MRKLDKVGLVGATSNEGLLVTVLVEPRITRRKKDSLRKQALQNHMITKILLQNW